MFGQSLSCQKQSTKLKLCYKNRYSILHTITTTMVEFPCGICQKAVAKRHKAICCDLCDK